MNRLIAKHKFHWADKQFLFSVIYGILFLAASLMANYITGTYATKKASGVVTDILLDNLPVFNVNFIFVNGTILFLIFIGALIIYEPKRIPFILKSVALFVVVRSIFVTMTHLGPLPGQIYIESNRFLEKITFGGDLFFSGHVGLPFLFALAFWGNKYFRYTFLAASIIGGVSVILGHLHYTIDVFAAFFISYGIFHIAQWLFAKDYKLFLHSLHQDVACH